MNSLTLDDQSHAATPVSKLTDRHDFAVKSDEPGTSQLAEYADPDALIESICLSEPCNADSNDSHSQIQSIWISHRESKMLITVALFKEAPSVYSL